TILTPPTAGLARAGEATTAAEAPVRGSGLAGVMLSMRMPFVPVSRVPLAAEEPVSPLEIIASVFFTEGSALSVVDRRLPACRAWRSGGDGAALCDLSRKMKREAEQRSRRTLSMQRGGCQDEAGGRTAQPQ